MKTIKLIYPLALALAVTLAATGCKHTPVGVTRIPGTTPNPTDTNPNPTLPNTTPMNQDNNVSSAQIPVADNSLFENMIMDRAALAAYTVHFAYDSAAIRNSEQANLQSVAQALSADAGTKLLIEGNCDERGTREYNFALGARRANQVKDFLIAHGVAAGRITTVSYGKERPIDTSGGPEAESHNRNAHTDIIDGAS